MKAHPRRVLLALLAVPALLLAACATSATAPSATAAAFPAQRGAPAVGDGVARTEAQVQGQGAFSAAAPVPAPVAVQPADAKPVPVPVPHAFEGDRALILTANVSLRAKDPWSVSDRVQAIATGLSGDVMSLAQSGSSDQRSATLVIRVPQARFNDALRQIRDIGDIEVVASNVDGKDVTDQFVDLEARLKAKQAEEQRYTALLARANTIEEILKIDNVLASVRTQIEQLTGQLNSIKARTTFSTITVQVSPLAPAPLPSPDPKAYDPSKTIERAVSSLTSLMRVAVDAAIWALVFSWIPLMSFGLVLLVSRARRFERRSAG